MTPGERRVARAGLPAELFFEAANFFDAAGVALKTGEFRMDESANELGGE
jgi:hypothetical protein